MTQRTCRPLAVAGLACLMLIPNSRACAAALRDDALSYRAQGYETQQLGDRTTALEYYRKAAALDAAYPVPWNDIGIMLE